LEQGCCDEDSSANAYRITRTDFNGNANADTDSNSHSDTYS
jgi:hypothetical protein